MKWILASEMGLCLIVSGCFGSGEAVTETLAPMGPRDGSPFVQDASKPDETSVHDASIPDENSVQDASVVDGNSVHDAGILDGNSVHDAGIVATCGGAAGACSLLDPCTVGAYRCSDAGLPECAAVSTKSNGSFCGYGLSCQSGQCVPGVATEDLLLFGKIVESAWFKAVVIWNPGARPIDLSRYGLCLQSNQYTSCNWHVMLAGQIPAGGTFVLCNGTASPDTQCDAHNTDVVNFNGDDRIGLFFDANQNGRVDYDSDLRVDFFGEPGVRPASEIWSDKTYRRHRCVSYLGGRVFDVAAWFDDVSVRSGDSGAFQPDRTSLRQQPICR